MYRISPQVVYTPWPSFSTILYIYIYLSSHTVCHLLVPSDSSFMYGLRFFPVLFNTGFAFPHTCFLPAPVHSALVAAFASLSLYIFFYCPRLKSDLTLWRVGAPLFRGGRWCSRQIVSHTFYLLLLTTSIFLLITAPFQCLNTGSHSPNRILPVDSHEGYVSHS